MGFYVVRQESAGPSDLKPIFVDSQALNFRVKGWSWKPQFRCRTTWTRDAAPSFCQGGLNHFFFLPLQRAIKPDCRNSELWRLPFEPRLVYAKNVAVAQDHSSFNYVLQFANVAWPLVGFEQFDCFLLNSSELLSSPFSKTTDKVVNKQRNIIRALAQRRHLNGHDI